LSSRDSWQLAQEGQQHHVMQSFNGSSGRPPRASRSFPRRPGARHRMTHGMQRMNPSASVVQLPVPIISDVAPYWHGRQNMP